MCKKYTIGLKVTTKDWKTERRLSRISEGLRHKTEGERLMATEQTKEMVTELKDTHQEQRNQINEGLLLINDQVEQCSGYIYGC
jgi:hypothetical protein